MPRPKSISLSWSWALPGLVLAFALAAGAALAAIGPPREASPAAALREHFERMRDEIDSSAFGRPLHLVSRDGDHVLKGDVYALVGHPFPQVEAALREPGQWCQVLILPFNVKRCIAGPGAAAPALSIFIAKRKDSTPDQSYRVDLAFRVESLEGDFMRIALAADSGPLGTRDYRIVLEATPAGERRTLVHLSYSYGYGMVSQVAMQAYLATLGAHKVGFTVQGRDDAGRPILVGGMRGVMERNTMRYFLAIEAYLDSLALPARSREEARLAQWFDAADRYPRQLHEVSRSEYLAMKHREIDAPGGCCRVAAGY